MTKPAVARSAGFSVVELVTVLGLISVVSAGAIPMIAATTRQTSLATATAAVEAQLRSARLAAVSRNARVRVVFDCPVAGALRILTVTGDAEVDDADDRCDTTEVNDGPAVYLPAEVAFDQPPTLEFNGRGIVTAIGDSVPVSITVSYGQDTRTLLVTAIGRVTTSSPE